MLSLSAFLEGFAFLTRAIKQEGIPPPPSGSSTGPERPGSSCRLLCRFNPERTAAVGQRRAIHAQPRGGAPAELTWWCSEDGSARRSGGGQVRDLQGQERQVPVPLEGRATARSLLSVRLTSRRPPRSTCRVGEEERGRRGSRRPERITEREESRVALALVILPFAHVGAGLYLRNRRR